MDPKNKMFLSLNLWTSLWQRGWNHHGWVNLSAAVKCLLRNDCSVQSEHQTKVIGSTNMDTVSPCHSISRASNTASLSWLLSRGQIWDPRQPAAVTEMHDSASLHLEPCISLTETLCCFLTISNHKMNITLLLLFDKCLKAKIESHNPLVGKKKDSNICILT